MQNIFKSLWADYVKIAPDAPRVHQLLTTRGEIVSNDHVALRTFRAEGIGLADLAQIFINLGYVARDTFVFTQKKLEARYFSHPDTTHPKVFISEIILDSFSAPFRKICTNLMSEAQAYLKKNGPLQIPLRPWQPIIFADYELLARESEYAAWLAAFGICVNHFTVSVNRLKTFTGIEELNRFLLTNGLVLNQEGGLVKGSELQGLKQSSTMSRQIDWMFADGPQPVPGCYYEFAERFVRPGTAQVFEGFIEASADKIFESTNRG